MHLLLSRLLKEKRIPRLTKFRYMTPPHHTPQPFYGLFSQDHPGEPVPEENFWTLWCKERSTEADTPTIRLGTIPSGLTSAHLHIPHFLQAGCPSCRTTNSVKALTANSTTRRRRQKQQQLLYGPLSGTTRVSRYQ